MLRRAYLVKQILISPL